MKLIALLRLEWQKLLLILHHPQIDYCLTLSVLSTACTCKHGRLKKYFILIQKKCNCNCIDISKKIQRRGNCLKIYTWLKKKKKRRDVWRIFFWAVHFRANILCDKASIYVVNYCSVEIHVCNICILEVKWYVQARTLDPNRWQVTKARSD